MGFWIRDLVAAMGDRVMIPILSWLVEGFIHPSLQNFRERFRSEFKSLTWSLVFYRSCFVFPTLSSLIFTPQYPKSGVIRVDISQNSP